MAAVRMAERARREVETYWDASAITKRLVERYRRDDREQEIAARGRWRSYEQDARIDNEAWLGCMVKLLQWCTRVAGIPALVLGLLIGRVSYDWLPRAHMTLGFVVVVALALIAISAFFSKLAPALPLVALLWAGGTATCGNRAD